MAFLVGDFEKAFAIVGAKLLHAYGEMIGAVFQMAAEFLEELTRQWSSNDHRTKGSILGRAFAEIFLAVGTGGTVAAAGHASKAARLGKLNVAKLPAPKAAPG